LIDKFPTSESALRGIKETNFADTMFVIRSDGGTLVCNLPKNAESFADNALMLSIIKLLAYENIKLTRSEKELPLPAFNTPIGEWLVGWVNAHCAHGGTKRADGESRHQRGFRAYQSQAIRERMGSKPVTHLKLEDDTPGKLLSQLATIPKEHWGIRGALSVLFRNVKVRSTNLDLSTFLRSEQDLLSKKVRRNLIFDNGGLFSSGEISYLKERYATQIEAIENGAERLKQRNSQLAEDFEAEFYDYRKAVKDLDARLKPIVTARAASAFPPIKKKKDEKFLKLSLAEKLLIFPEPTLQKFSPHHICEHVKTAPEEAVDPADRRLYYSSYGIVEGITEDELSLVSAYNRLLGLRAE
jgi:hypothetical protein